MKSDVVVSPSVMVVASKSVSDIVEVEELMMIIVSTVVTAASDADIVSVIVVLLYSGVSGVLTGKQPTKFAQ